MEGGTPTPDPRRSSERGAPEAVEEVEEVEEAGRDARRIELRRTRQTEPRTAPVRSIPALLLISVLLAAATAVAAIPPALPGEAEPPPTPPQDRVTVLVPAALAADPQIADRGGLLLVMLLPATRAPEDLPAEGPWWRRPHPLLARTIDRIGDLPRDPGGDGRVDLTSDESATRSFPGPLEDLEGVFRVQAVLRPLGGTVHRGGRGEWRSAEIEVALDPRQEDRLLLQLEGPIEDQIEAPTDSPAIRRISIESPLLARHGAPDPMLRAWVVFPRRYHDLAAPRRSWPAIVVIPHRGDGRDEAQSLAAAIAIEPTARAMPQAVWVVLDPSTPWGHHGVADSERHGPQASALVRDLIPHLERRFRIERGRDARLLWGHGSGGWSALWLLAEHPETFGAAFATSPEGVDHRHLAGVDAAAECAFTVAGRSRPAYREPIGAESAVVRTVVEQEIRLAAATDPLGRSGNRWHRLAARMSPVEDERPPRLLFDPVSGRIDPAIADAWRGFDLADRMRRDRRTAAVLARRAWVWCGDRDEFLHDLGVAALEDALAPLRIDPASGRVVIIPHATFESVVPQTRIEIYREIVDWLRSRNLHD